ncbi:hypothetical protein D3C83_21380 [compost metagenome]
MTGNDGDDAGIPREFGADQRDVGLVRGGAEEVPAKAEGIGQRRNDVLPGQQKENEVMCHVIRDGDGEQRQHEIARHLTRRESAGERCRDPAGEQKHDAENNREQQEERGRHGVVIEHAADSRYALREPREIIVEESPRRSRAEAVERDRREERQHHRRR